MAQYRVEFARQVVQYEAYNVEAKDEEKAIKLAWEKFQDFDIDPDEEYDKCGACEANNVDKIED